MKSFVLALVGAPFFAMAIAAQNPTPVTVTQHANSQVNTLPSCLICTASVQAPGYTTTFFFPSMTLFTPSSTFAYTCDGNAGSATGTLTHYATAEGAAPNYPFILAAALEPATTTCGGPASVPCMTGPSLFSNIPTPHGLYHLGPNPIFILDGIAGLAPPAFLNANRQYSLFGSYPIDPAGYGGPEPRLAVQLLTFDPSAPSGYLLSAALVIEQWVSY